VTKPSKRASTDGAFKRARPDWQAPAAKGAQRRPSEIDAHVGARLRALRLARDMAQAELGARLGVSFMQVQKYEAGANRIAAARLYAIARVLAVRVDSFFEGLR
jgi:ribosome-binding protein aMBF1 (putative translation factor)